MVEARATHAEASRAHDKRNPTRYDYLERMSAKNNTTFGSRWALYFYRYPDAPKCCLKPGVLLILKQPKFAELVAASAKGDMPDDVIADELCKIVGVRNLAAWDPAEASPWQCTQYADLRTLMRIIVENGDGLTLFMTDIEQEHGGGSPSFSSVWDAALCELCEDGTVRLVWRATAAGWRHGRDGRGFSRGQVCRHTRAPTHPGACMLLCVNLRRNMTREASTVRAFL